MSFHAATIGQLLIVEAFVLIIWLKVFVYTIKNQPPNPQYAKLLTTSSGLVISSLAIFFLMVIRAYELYYQIEYKKLILACYAVLAFGSFLFIVSASIGNSWKQVKLFVLVSFAWTSIYIFSQIV